MFAAGTKSISTGEDDGLPPQQERKMLAFLRSSFTDRQLGLSLLPAIDAEETPDPLLPPGWEQRLDETNGRIFFVDHNTCVALTVVPQGVCDREREVVSRVQPLTLWPPQLHHQRWPPPAHFAGVPRRGPIPGLIMCAARVD